MYRGLRVLAVVPARSGSKGIPDKNMRVVGGRTLIARAGDLLSAMPELDARIISTDAAEYAEEGRSAGLDAPFLRPPELARDESGAVETLQHALAWCEAAHATTYDVILIIEPTSPLRRTGDLRESLDLLMDSGADSVVTVSPANPKFHPMKLLTSDGGRLAYYRPDGAQVVARQQIGGELYWRNGVCYALTRSCLVDRHAVITENSVPLIMHRQVVNIDEPFELELAEFLLRVDGPDE